MASANNTTSTSNTVNYDDHKDNNKDSIMNDEEGYRNSPERCKSNDSKGGKKVNYPYSMDASVKRCISVVDPEQEVRNAISTFWDFLLY